MPRKKTKPLTLKQLIDELLKRYDGNDNKTVEISWESDSREINPGDICQVNYPRHKVVGFIPSLTEKDSCFIERSALPNRLASLSRPPQA